MKLRSKLLLQIIIVSTLVLLAFNVTWIVIAKNQLAQFASEADVASAQQNYTRFQNYFDHKITILNTYANTLPETQTDLSGIFLLDDDITTATVFTNSGEIKFSESVNPTLVDSIDNPVNNVEFKVASYSKGQIYVGNVFKKGESHYVRFGVPMPYPVKNHNVLIATVQLTPLEEQLQKSKINEKDFIAIIDRSKNKNIITAESLQNTENPSAESSQTSKTSSQKAIKTLIFYSVGLLAAGILLAALLGLIVTQSTVKAFRGLRDGFDNFNKGNLAFRIPVKGKGEIEELSRSLNKMIGDIHEEYQKVDKEKASVAAEKEKEQKEFVNEKEHMKQVLTQDEEKVNRGLFVEKEKVKAVMENITDAVILLNKKREIMSFNKVAEDLLGSKSNELENKLITAAMKVFEKDNEIPWDEYAPLNNGAGNIFKKEKVRLENSTITPRIVTMQTVKTNFEQSDDLGFIIILHNLDQELQLEKTEMNFVGAVIKELKTPLAIISQCFPLLQQSAPPEGQNIYMKGMQTGVDQISLLMQNFILATQLEEHKLQPDIQPIDIAEVISEACDVISLQAQGKPVSLTFEQPTEQISKVSADVGNIKAVLLNLLGNAIKFTPQQGTVAITIRQLNDEMIVEIQDGGPGIPKEELPNLFKKFYTIKNTQDTDAIGTGLGLYIAKSLTELNHGKIWVDSVEGKGSTFGFSLPKA